ncbi:MAG: carbon monoxide dehydrogenase subunit G [Chloroflexota bacterium]
MEFSGSVDIRATPDHIFAFVTDPNRVSACGPGVDSIEVIDPTHFRVTSRVGVGFISARFVVDLEIVEQQPPVSAVITAHGQAPGSSVDATGRISLVDGPEPGVTTMDWEADVSISGMLAGVGSRMIDSTADKIIAQTFDCIRARIAEEA